jgi:hypothetical protein
LEKEIKIVKYVLLTYVMYGLMNVFILKDFVVPLPIIYIVIPLVAVYFFILSIRSSLSWFFIFIPLVVLKDVMMEYNINFVAIISIISLFTWVIFGIVIYNQTTHKSKLLLIYSILIMTSIFTLLPTDFNFSWIIFPLIGIMGSWVLKNNLESKIISELTFDLKQNDSIVDHYNFNSSTELSKNNRNLLILNRITLLIILICGFYTITLISIWSMLI